MIRRLDPAVFRTVVENTPLISIDLIVKNARGEVLLGLRQNRPAKNSWFVPGGRIFKDESFADAFQRIGREELGLEVNLRDGTFLGVFEHFYRDNFSSLDFSTHYVVHGYELIVDDRVLALPLEQHGAYCWFDIHSMLSHSDVHQYTKNYFLSR